MLTSTPKLDGSTPADSTVVRHRLVEALNLDLIGPGAGHDLASERLPGWVRPSNWYLTGLPHPRRCAARAERRRRRGRRPRRDAGIGRARGGVDGGAQGREEGLLPLVDGLELPRRGGRGHGQRDRPLGGLRAGADRGTPTARPPSVWQRRQHERTVPVSVARADHYRVADSGGLWLHAEVRPIDTAGIAGIPAGTRSVSVFLVNRRDPDEDNPDLAYAFQAEIEVQGERAFVPRPDLRGARALDPDEQVADLHYADTPELATGHGVSADWEVVDGDCRRLRTTWIPSASVEKTETVHPFPASSCRWRPSAH